MSSNKLPGKKGAGRPPGTPNKRTLDLIETLESKGYNAAAELVWAFQEAKKQYLEADEKQQELLDAIRGVDGINFNTMNALISRDNKPAYLALCANTAKELMGYVYPKRKAIEVSKTNPFDGLSHEEMVEKAKALVKFLEEGSEQ